VLLLNSPHNPTGGVLTRADLERIAELAIRNDVTVISDEIYNRNLYDAEFFSIAALDGMRERTILLDGFSKAYAMTGWRLGYAIMPVYVARMVSLMGQNTYSCTATFVQLAGAAALSGPDEPVQAMVAEFRRRRDAIVGQLNSLPGVTCKTPEGAFYVFPNVSQITRDDARLASYLLEDAGVAALGGSAFGEAGRGYMRFSYAASLDTIHAALERVRDALPNFKA
jgi:aspartate/methionine/tyrosine aminotransferase